MDMELLDAELLKCIESCERELPSIEYDDDDYLKLILSQSSQSFNKYDNIDSISKPNNSIGNCSPLNNITCIQEEKEEILQVNLLNTSDVLDDFRRCNDSIITHPQLLENKDETRDCYSDDNLNYNSFKETKTYLQQGNCLDLPSNIKKCIDCRHQKVKKKTSKHVNDNLSCRFYSFRLLKLYKSKELRVGGFPDPYKSPNVFDINLWLPVKHSPTPINLNREASIKILEDIGDQFCKIVQDENEALHLYLGLKRKKQHKVFWKKYLNSMREMCDVCKTSIFNYHLSCDKCGFIVCVDCFRMELGDIPKNRKKKSWLLCHNNNEHNVRKLSITQLLTGAVLNQISKSMHSTCIGDDINISCSCIPKSNNYKPQPGDSIKLVTDVFLDKAYASHISNTNYLKTSPNLFTLISKENLDLTNSETEDMKYKNDHIYYSTILNKNIQDESINDGEITDMKMKKEFVPRLSLMQDNNNNIPYMWLCNGRVLRLLDPNHNDNCRLFQKQWKRGQPVLVSNVGKNLSSTLWNPKSFSRDFGNQKNDIIDCTTSTVFNYPISKFWDGFEDVAKRLCDKEGKPMLLKLKDWPPSADFAEVLPNRFQDLMNSLPLKEYTHRNGLFNLVSHLPEYFLRPDLGPKMYTAYGNAGSGNIKVSTTNLHLDITDAVNVMVYVAISKNCKENNHDWYANEALEVLKKAGCDDLTMERIYTHGEIPGALWHIYNASDSAAIRDLLIRVSTENVQPLEENCDQIHDQSQYLDDCLRERLFKEYGIKGYTIVQFNGDAVFIPAGAPHQVRNLHNCIKIAEDFVSPENVHHSFNLTQEFRYLSDNHNNHEDKLQIKNIIYHAVKNSISVLSKSL